MKVSNDEKARQGEEAVSRATLLEWQKRDINTQRESTERRNRTGDSENGRKRFRKES
jgi:hypothetical protein